MQIYSSAFKIINQIDYNNRDESVINCVGYAVLWKMKNLREKTEYID